MQRLKGSATRFGLVPIKPRGLRTARPVTDLDCRRTSPVACAYCVFRPRFLCLACGTNPPHNQLPILFDNPIGDADLQPERPEGVVDDVIGAAGHFWIRCIRTSLLKRSIKMVGRPIASRSVTGAQPPLASCRSLVSLAQVISLPSAFSF